MLTQYQKLFPHKSALLRITIAFIITKIINKGRDRQNVVHPYNEVPLRDQEKSVIKPQKREESPSLYLPLPAWDVKLINMEEFYTAPDG